MSTSPPTGGDAGNRDALDWLHEQGKKRDARVPEFDLEQILTLLWAVRNADESAHRHSAPLDTARLSRSSGSASFWDSLTGDQRRAFRYKAHKRVFAAGARLMREGEYGDHVAVILSGLTEIRVYDNGTERVVAERGPGQLIGERAALEMNPRSPPWWPCRRWWHWSSGRRTSPPL